MDIYKTGITWVKGYEIGGPRVDALYAWPPRYLPGLAYLGPAVHQNRVTLSFTGTRTVLE
jgi:hypothetical protein